MLEVYAEGIQVERDDEKETNAVKRARIREVAMTYASLMFCFVTEAKHKSEAKLRIWLRRLFLCVHALSMRALETRETRGCACIYILTLIF